MDIYDASATETPNIFARSLILDSDDFIGTIDEDLDIAVNYNTTGGNLTAYAKVT